MSADGEDLRRELEERPTEELVAILRNRDEEEWRPEVFPLVAAILEARGVSPAEVEGLGPEGYDVVEGRELATVGTYTTPLAAHAHRMALEEAGLLAFVQDEVTGTTYGFAVGARLQVRREDLAAARAVLASDPAPGAAFPPELREPED